MNEGRDQHANKDLAYQFLQSKLSKIEEDNRRSEKKGEYDALGSNGWGSQIRSYTLQPYQLVKDTHTKTEQKGSIKKFLAGHIDKFLQTQLEAGL